MSILNDLGLNGLGELGTNLRSRAHATKIFVDGKYELAPKYGFLYYVHIETNIVPSKSTEIGMLVKTAQLPKFNVDLKKLNSYNRPIYAQTKIHYEPVTITFHDDNADKVRNFWRDYFKHYYRDSDNTLTQFGATVNAKYDQDNQFSNWGYSPKSYTPYLKQITIYSLHQKKYSAYTLVNPIIKSFQHGEHNYGSNDTMTNSMTLEYESVLYSSGKVSKSSIPGFLDLRYDSHPSPLTPAGGGTASILGEGGLVDTADEIGSDLEEGNYGAAIFKGVQGLNNASKMNLKDAATSEILSMGKEVLQGSNSSNSIFIPAVASVTSGAKDWVGASIGGVFKPSKKGSRVNQEVTDSTGSSSPLAGIANLLPKIGTFSVKTALSNTSNLDIVESAALDGEILLDQTLQVTQPTNQFTVNETQLLTTLRYNLAVAQQNKINLQIKIQQITDQQQMVSDAIVSLTNKRDSLLGSNSNELLVQQLSLQIEQQHTTVIENDELIANTTAQLVQLEKRIELINAKITGLI